MSRYFFHVEGGRLLRDGAGTDLSTLADARTEATRVLGEILQNRPETFWEGGLLKVIVEDDQGLTLFIVTVYADDSAAVMRPIYPL